MGSLGRIHQASQPHAAGMLLAGMLHPEFAVLVGQVEWRVVGVGPACYRSMLPANPS